MLSFSGLHDPPLSGKNIKRNNKLGQKKVVLFPEIDRIKIFLSLTRPLNRMCIRIYIFNLKKKNNKPTAATKKSINQKKQKKYRKKENISGNCLKEINLQLLGSRFFSSPAFSERKILFY